MPDNSLPEGWNELPPLTNARAAVETLYPNARVTSGSRPKNHPLSQANPKSWHVDSEAAVDVAPIEGLSFGGYLAGLKKAGYEIVQAKDEATDPAPWTTGPNWHVVLAGGPAPEKAPATDKALPEGWTEAPAPAAGEKKSWSDWGDEIAATGRVVGSDTPGQFDQWRMGSYMNLVRPLTDEGSNVFDYRLTSAMPVTSPIGSAAIEPHQWNYRKIYDEASQRGWIKWRLPEDVDYDKGTEWPWRTQAEAIQKGYDPEELYDIYESYLKGRYEKELETAGAVAEQADWVPWLAGALAGSALDPVNALPIGGGPAKGLLKTAGKMALQNAGIELAEQPFFSMEREHSGRPGMTLEERALGVLGAAGLGGLLGGGSHLLGKLGKEAPTAEIPEGRAPDTAPEASPEAPVRAYSDLSPAEQTELNAKIAKAQEPLITDEVTGEYRNETPEEKGARHAAIDKDLEASLRLDSPRRDVVEEPAKPSDFKRDNPEGDWLSRKQEQAMETYAPDEPGLDAKGLRGSTTGYSRIELPVSALKSLRGVNNEEPLSAPQFADLKKSIAESGYDPKSRVMVWINHKGEAFLYEGNTRVAAAADAGVDFIPVEIQWRNGAEDIEGPWHPSKVAELEKTKAPDDVSIGPQPPVVDRLITAIQEARPVRREQERLYSAERAKRIAAAEAVGEKTSGEEGFHAEKAALGGELPKANFESIRDQFTQDDLVSLFDHIKNAPHLDFYASLTAREGLSKMLSGSVPTKSELTALAQVFPDELIAGLEKNRPFGKKLAEHVANGLNLPRALMATADFSAPFRQALFLSTRKEFWKALPSMFKQFASPEAFKAAQDSIAASPYYSLMKQYGLEITGAGRDLAEREESFQSPLAEKIPVMGQVVKASERAYVGFLNKVRADLFTNLMDSFKAAGLDPTDTASGWQHSVGQSLALFLNVFTGRGQLPTETLRRSAPILNAALFAPKLMSSRIQLLGLDPTFYPRLHPAVRKEALKSAISAAGMILTIAGVAAMAGADVETDVRSSDFLKIRIGDTRLDPWGGTQQYVVAIARLLAGQTKSSGSGRIQTLGEEYRGDTRWDVVTKFFSNKASPMLSFVMNMLEGTDPVGRPVTLSSEALDKFVPLIVQDMTDAIKEYGPVGALAGIPAAFGVGASTYPDNNPYPEFEEGSAAKEEIARLDEANGDYILPRIEKKVDTKEFPVGELTDEQYEDYSRQVTYYLDQQLGEALETPEYKELSDEEKVDFVKDAMKTAKQWAREELFSPETKAEDWITLPPEEAGVTQ